MEQVKYRIRVEVVEGVEIPKDEMPDQRLLDGVECNGFTLLLHKGRTSAAIVSHDITVCDMAVAMKGEPKVQAAAEIAKILERVEEEQIPDFFGIAGEKAQGKQLTRTAGRCQPHAAVV